MKVLHFRLDAPGYSSDGIEQGFRNNGFEYEGHNWQALRFQLGTDGFKKRIIELAATAKADLIFCHFQNPEAVDRETMRGLSFHGFTINFTEDVRKKLDWFKDLAASTDLTIFTNREDVKSLLDDGYTAAYMPTSYNDTWYKKLPFFEPVPGKYPEIVFIGNNFSNTDLDFERSGERVEMVDFLKQSYGKRFRHYGINWGDESIHINPQEAINIYNSCKIAITHNNFYRSGYSSDRLFNCLGCGAFTISQYYPGIEQHFKKSIHLEWWKTFDELKKIIDAYLSDDMERHMVAAMGNAHVRDAHSWTARIAEVREIFLNMQDA